MGICGILQANKLLKLVARTISRKQRDDVSAQIRALKGHESLAQGSAQGLPRVYPGFVVLLRRTLTRRYLVAPCWKNTRSAGLEVLKGC
ncbi:MAG: hypothetical protein QOE88_1158 [Verrucomicrobiota bacterium]|nr:hypothetical protein [Verrucomicrobiota bacterium]